MKSRLAKSYPDTAPLFDDLLMSDIAKRALRIVRPSTPPPEAQITQELRKALIALLPDLINYSDSRSGGCSPGVRSPFSNYLDEKINNARMVITKSGRAQ